ncbi:hypothetical protein GQ44DRAFT_769455 [Phaeosphaeriaceae sp. PMI808]|nr:hypothetical protein GQ44DRAFT_769455 [Phaeosphaeriaceae sp. PMI808]
MTATKKSLPTPKVPVDEKHKQLLIYINEFVHTYMSQPGHDSSHDYLHILRVVSNANRILEAETRGGSLVKYDTCALFLAAFLHDIGDRKYATPGEDIENQIFTILCERGANEELAQKVQTIVKHVSYTHEVRDPQAVLDTMQKYPELAVVQDADRLDAIGAVGIARCLSYGAAKFPEKPMARTIEHFDEKLYKLANMMKTQSGKEMAQKRKGILERFASEFQEESQLSFEFE